MEDNTLKRALTFENLEGVLNEYGKAVLTAYQRDLREKRKPTTRNTLVSTARYLVDVDGGTIEVSLSLQDYWKYVEHGRAAGGKFPPIDAIEEWIRIKPVIPHPDAKGRIPSEHSLAFLIARSIAKNGIPPTNSLRGSVQAQNNAFRKRLAQAAQKDLKRYVTEYLFAGTD